MKKFFILGFMTLSMIFAMDDIERALQAFNDRDYTQALKLLQKACNGGDMISCETLKEIQQ